MRRPCPDMSITIRAGEVIAPRQRGEESPSSAGQGGPETGQGATPWTVPQKRRPPARVRVKRWGKSPPDSRATGNAWKTPPGARPHREASSRATGVRTARPRLPGRSLVPVEQSRAQINDHCSRATGRTELGLRPALIFFIAQQDVLHGFSCLERLAAWVNKSLCQQSPSRKLKKKDCAVETQERRSPQFLPRPKQKKKEEYTDAELFTGAMDGRRGDRGIPDPVVYEAIRSAGTPSPPLGEARTTIFRQSGSDRTGGRSRCICPIPRNTSSGLPSRYQENRSSATCTRAVFAVQAFVDLHGFTVPEAEDGAGSVPAGCFP